MYIFKKVADIQEFIATERKKGLKVGFVPTMGALHMGHISSIFVNPTQFDNADDLQKYARNLPKDAEMLGRAKVEVLFAPSVQEIYPPGLETEVNLKFGGLTKVMEGRFREGHFEGMVQVVNRLLDIVKPDSLYMGQKDFQQAAIVNNMLVQQESNIKLVICPIIREAHGLAMSSRNERLESEDRQKAKAIQEALLQLKENISSKDLETLKKEAVAHLVAVGFKPDYLEIVDGDSLQHITKYEDSKYIVACVAAYMKDVRLIDNMILRNEKG